MTNIEDIESAIEKLSALRADSTGGDWNAYVREGHHAYEGTIRTDGLPDDVSDEIAEIFIGVDAELIVTLHRTIDAQLGVLLEGAAAISDREALMDVYAWDDGEWARNTSAESVALVFARAINA